MSRTVKLPGYCSWVIDCASDHPCLMRSASFTPRLLTLVFTNKKWRLFCSPKCLSQLFSRYQSWSCPGYFCVGRWEYYWRNGWVILPNTVAWLIPAMLIVLMSPSFGTIFWRILLCCLVVWPGNSFICAGTWQRVFSGFKFLPLCL